MLIRLLRKLLTTVPSPARPSPRPMEDQRSLAVSLHREGRLTEAEATYRLVLAHSPDDAAVLGLLGHCLTLQGRFDEAVEFLKRAAEIDPDSAETLFNLALAYKSQGAFLPAVSCLRKAIQLRPDFVEAYANAAEVLKLSGDYAGAESHFRKALEIAPGHAEAHYNFGIFHYNLGRPNEAIESFRRALAIKPDFALAHGSLVSVMSGAPGYTAPEIYREQRAWASRFADPLTPGAPRYANRPDRQRRLRIGYLSADLWRHPIANFFEPLLVCHDRAGFEIVCYDAARVNDAVNQRLRTRADRWIECAGLGDEALAKRIGDDQIDILVDLSAHTKNNRLPVFARKPAPVLVSYLGYPTSTGVAAIDYRISDHEIDPVAVDEYSAEKVVRLADTYYCFRAPENLPDVGPLPAVSRGHVTFGSFNNIVKLEPQTIELWSRVLNALPAAQLFLKTKSLSDAQMRQHIAALFQRQGVAEDRLILRGWEAQTAHHLAQYNDVDIALDPAHYNGATTTCEALLMGVPVVTLKGNTHLSRLGASVLRAAGLPEMVTATSEQFVEKCAALARDLPALAQLRSRLRAQVQASALMDEAGFTRALEDVYRTMWASWCDRQA
jgi:predicted O-linked N-acetylglucosamine transferase (SPINDLY family)